jgi:hypothetical protein
VHYQKVPAQRSFLSLSGLRRRLFKKSPLQLVLLLRNLKGFAG